MRLDRFLSNLPCFSRQHVRLLLVERRDALTALGLSFAMTNQNLRPCLAWGGIVAAGMALSAATGLLGLIVIFPLLGHGTWHAWVALRPEGVQGQ